MERYCPDCKQNVEVDEEFSDTCLTCGYVFSIWVDKADIEELVKALESTATNSLWKSLEARESVEQVTAKFREKYLEGK